MRIISQDGKLDLPYEKLILRIIQGKYKDVMYVAIIEEGRNLTIAKYSSEEKAQKAMDMLHETYVGSSYLFQNIEVQEDDVAEILKKHCIDGIVVNTDDSQEKVEKIGNVIFRLPQDDEIEL